VAQRLLALLGAIAIVVAAVLVRSAIDDGDGSRSDRSPSDGHLVVVCARDLAAACDGLTDVTVIDEDAATTAARIGSGSRPDGADLWLTTSAWTEVVEARAAGAIGRVTPLAATPVAVAVDPARADAITALCRGTALWRCLGDASGKAWETLGGDPRWGTLRVGLPSASSATGLGVLASVASGYFGATGFASNDFDTTDFPGWLDTLLTPSGTGEREPVATLVTTRGRYTAVGDVAAAATGRRVTVVAPEPALDVTAVVAQLPGGDAVEPSARTVTALRQALVERGWKARSGGAVAPTLAVPGVLAALHSLWVDVTR
jgi:hypothetical protein